MAEQEKINRMQELLASREQQIRELKLELMRAKQNKASLLEDYEHLLDQFTTISHSQPAKITELSGLPC